MALNTGIGSEVQRPLATVVIGGRLLDAARAAGALPPPAHDLGALLTEGGGW
jgi:Cu/Ag efflux pump CusA